MPERPAKSMFDLIARPEASPDVTFLRFLSAGSRNFPVGRHREITSPQSAAGEDSRKTNRPVCEYRYLLCLFCLFYLRGFGSIGRFLSSSVVKPNEYVE